MKKLFSIIIATIIIACSAISAQKVNQWYYKSFPADELKGTREGKSLFFRSENNDCVCLVSMTPDWCIYFESKWLLDREYIDGDGYVDVLFGFYTKEGKLIHKSKYTMSADFESAISINLRILADMKAYLFEKTNYMRVIIPRYRKADIDIIMEQNADFRRLIFNELDNQ